MAVYLINSEGLGTEAYNYGIRKILNRDLGEHEKQYLLGKPFKALKELFPFLSLLETERIIEETLGYYKKYNHNIKEYSGIRQATHAANMTSIAALWGEGKKERLFPLNPTYLFDSPSQIVTLLLN